MANAKGEERDQRSEKHRTLMEQLARLRAQPSPNEQEQHQKSFGTWTMSDRVNASWRTECLGVLLWAGCRIDSLPKFDEQFSGEPLFAAAFSTGWSLRSLAELDGALTEAVEWHSRARRIAGFFLEEEERVGLVVSSRDLDKELQQSTQRPAAVANAMRTALGETVSAFGKPYERLTFVEFSTARSIARERHYALNWIWDGGPWDDVNTDT